MIYQILKNKRDIYLVKKLNVRVVNAIVVREFDADSFQDAKEIFYSTKNKIGRKERKLFLSLYSLLYEFTNKMFKYFW